MGKEEDDTNDDNNMWIDNHASGFRFVTLVGVLRREKEKCRIRFSNEIVLYYGLREVLYDVICGYLFSDINRV